MAHFLIVICILVSLADRFRLSVSFILNLVRVHSTLWQEEIETEHSYSSHKMWSQKSLKHTNAKLTIPRRMMVDLL